MAIHHWSCGYGTATANSATQFPVSIFATGMWVCRIGIYISSHDTDELGAVFRVTTRSFCDSQVNGRPDFCKVENAPARRLIEDNFVAGAKSAFSFLQAQRQKRRKRGKGTGSAAAQKAKIKIEANVGHRQCVNKVRSMKLVCRCGRGTVNASYAQEFKT